MNRGSGLGLAAALAAWFLLWSGSVSAQSDGPWRLEVWLRLPDGAAAAGETIILERLPEEEPLPCVTDAAGLCVWRVGRGLYQAIFSQPLDQISALSVAEGGLRGFGLTVGEADIAYHFTLHSDGHPYFDAAPEAAAPAPIIPALDSWQGGAAPTPALPLDYGPPLTATATPAAASNDDAPSNDAAPPPGQNWRPLIFIGLGLLLGGGLHFWTKRGGKRGDEETARQGDKETRRQGEGETPCPPTTRLTTDD